MSEVGFTDSSESGRTRRPHVVSVRMTPTEFEAVSAAAERRGVSVSQLIRDAAHKRIHPDRPSYPTNRKVEIAVRLYVSLAGNQDEPLWNVYVDDAVCCAGHAVPEDAIDHAMFKARDSLRAQIEALPEGSCGREALTLVRGQRRAG